VDESDDLGLGSNPTPPGMFTVRRCDAGEHMEKLSAAAKDKGCGVGGSPKQTLSLIFLDPYDAAGDVPTHLTGARFLENCVLALGPGGVLVANLWNGDPGSSKRKAMENFCVKLGVALGESGLVYTIRVHSQQGNVIVVGVKSPERSAVECFSRQVLVAGARKLGAKFSFDPGALCQYAFFVPQTPHFHETLPGGEGTSAVDLTKFTSGSPSLS